MLETGFDYLANIDPSIQYDIRYATSNNLVGRKIAGYEKNVCIVSIALGEALKRLQADLKLQNLELFVYETYRPQRASDDLQQWGLDAKRQENKQLYYPNVNKAEFNALGYVNQHSPHTRGAAVDLTLLRNDNGQALEMGTRFDFMDPLSHPSCTDINDTAYANRQFLQQLMSKHGFHGLKTEWWHFNLLDEPFPERYFDFLVE